MPQPIEAKTALLEPLGTVVAPATTAPVVIRDLFTTNTRIKFANTFSEFKGRFFDKTEKPSKAVTYRKYKLLRISPDGPIIAELGGESKVEATFGAAFALLQLQPGGEAGFLQTNGYANIFYSKDKQKELCAIRIAWTSAGWVVDTISVRDPLAWNGQHEIFCPVA